MNMSNKTTIQQQLENDKKQLLEYIFETNSNILKYSKYSIINDSNFLSLNVEELIQFLKKSSPQSSTTNNNSVTNLNKTPTPPTSLLSSSTSSTSSSSNSIFSPLPAIPTQTTNTNTNTNHQPQPNAINLIKSPPPSHNNELNNSFINSITSPPPPPTKSPPTVTTSNDEQIKLLLPENYGILSKEQFHFSSYETYLLFCHLSGNGNHRSSTSGNDIIEHQKQEDSFRVQNEISKVKHDGFIKSLTTTITIPPTQAQSSPAPPKNSIIYRLWLLKYFNFNLFDSRDSLLIWFKRQLYTILSSIINLIKYQDPFDERENSIVNQLKLLSYNLEISFQQQPSPTSVTDPIYSIPFNNLDSFIGNILLKSHQYSPQPSTTSPPPPNTLATKNFNDKIIQYQFPLNTNIFEDLLFYNLFEFDDDDGIRFIGDEYFRVASNLKPFSSGLKISPTMEQICHLNCFLMSYQAEPTSEQLRRLQTSLNTIHRLIESNASLVIDPSTSSGPLLKVTLKKIASWLVKLLSDVHSFKSADNGESSSPTKDITSYCSIYIQSREMWSLLSSSKSNGSGGSKTSESSFASFITSSVSMHYQRISQSFRPITLDNFSEFVEILIPEVKLNLDVYTSGFKQYHSRARNLALEEFVNLYSNDLKIVFADVYFLSPMLLKSVQSASNFQLMLEKLNLIPIESMPPIKTYVSSVIGTWCQNQEKDFCKWFENIFKLDKFQALDKDVKHSSSVVDMFTMFYQTISTLAKMKGSLSDNFPAFILTLSALFNSNCLLAYNSSIESLTMCNEKQAVLYPLSLNEKIQNKSKIRKSIATSSNQLTSSLQLTSSKSIPDPTQTVITAKLSTMNLSKLCICVNNLDYILLNINTYINEHSFNNETLRGKLKELFSSTQITIADTLKSLVDFIGARVVFYECKQSIIESMYLGSITNCKDRVSEPLESLSPHLKTIYNSTSSLERGNDILASVCRAFLQATEYCILYGGPQRYFQPKDAELIEFDLQLIKDFFLDRDEHGNPTAMSDELFDSYVSPLSKIAQLLMDLSTDILIEQYEGRGGKHSFTKETILCILVHRNEKPARSFIKKKLNDSHYLSIKKNSKINFLT